MRAVYLRDCRGCSTKEANELCVTDVPSLEVEEIQYMQPQKKFKQGKSKSPTKRVLDFNHKSHGLRDAQFVCTLINYYGWFRICKLYCQTHYYLLMVAERSYNNFGIVYCFYTDCHSKAFSNAVLRCEIFIQTNVHRFTVGNFEIQSSMMTCKAP